jgi:hypothetical protein
MPKIAINWETTSVSFYKFVCKDPSILYSYVGHTTSFSKRKSGHKTNCNNPKRKAHNIPLYVFIRANGGFENWSMIEIQSQICKDKREAERIENELMEHQQFKLNAQRAFITEEQMKKRDAEYREQHKEQAAEYAAEYYEQHKEQLVSYAVEYYKTNKEQIAIKRAERYQKRKLANMTK